MTEIRFDADNERQNGWTWHYGNVEQDNKEYPFTLLEMYDSNSDSSEFELTWCDDTPDNSDSLEKQILEKFSELFA